MFDWIPQGLQSNQSMTVLEISHCSLDEDAAESIVHLFGTKNNTPTKLATTIAVHSSG